MIIILNIIFIPRILCVCSFVLFSTFLCFLKMPFVNSFFFYKLEIFFTWRFKLSHLFLVLFLVFFFVVCILWVICLLWIAIYAIYYMVYTVLYCQYKYKYLLQMHRKRRVYSYRADHMNDVQNTQKKNTHICYEVSKKN